jgi:protease-4
LGGVDSAATFKTHDSLPAIAVEKKNTSKAWIIVLIAGSVLFFIALLSMFFLFLPVTLSQNNVAVIEIRGTITEYGAGSFGSQGASASSIGSFIEEADHDPLIDAIVLDINSPGGSAVASDEIAQAVKDASKPTVAFIHEIGTSGAYWIASAADTIIANRMSMTGSIGVLGSYLEFSGLMEDYGVSYQRFVSGKYKDIGTPFKQPTKEEQQIFQSKLDALHDYFIAAIAENRELTKSQVRAIATGEFFLGEEALNIGLVDMVGDKKTLEDHLKNTLNATDIEFIYYQQEASLLDVLGVFIDRQFFLIGKGIGSALTGQQELSIRT